MLLLRFPRYLGFFAAIALIVLFAAAGFVMLVDPQGLYGLVRINGFNAKKPYQAVYADEVKALAARRYRPDTLLFGASTVELGIVTDCLAASLPGVSRVYNYGGAGDGPSDFVVANPDLGAISSLQRIEVESRFVAHRFRLGGKLAFARVPKVAEPAKGWAAEMIRPWLPANYAGDYFADLFSISGIAVGGETIAANRSLDQSTVFGGFQPNGSFDQQWLRRMTAWVLTEQAVLDHVSAYNAAFAEHISADMTADFGYVDEFAADAQRHGRSLDFFITPEHVVELLLYREAGLWPLYEKFKLDLLKTVDVARQRYAVGIRVFDFGNLNEVTTQPLRQSDDHSIHDPYFSDVVHFRKIVGDYMLATMLGCRIAEALPADFGLEIADGNIGDHLTAERTKLDAYVREHADLVEKIAEIVSRHSAASSVNKPQN